MATFKYNYWKYSLIILIVFIGIILFNQFRPFLTGLLGAFTMYTVLRKQMFYFVEKKRFNKTIAALICITEVVLCILIPTFLIIWMLLGKIQHFDLNIEPFIDFIKQYIALIREKTGYNLLNVDNLTTATSYFTKFIHILIGQVSNIIVNSIVLVFLLYFMLISGRNMEGFIYGLLPFNDKNKANVIDEIKRMVLSNAIGIPLLAIIQGGIALLGYWIFNVPSALLFGFMTCFATIIPLVGTGLVWVPLCIYFMLSGNWFNAIGLFLYSLIILTNVDNVIRLIIQKQMADTHPLITVFGVILGLPLFGFWGVIFGPLLLSMFFLLIQIFKKEYIENDSELTRK